MSVYSAKYIEEALSRFNRVPVNDHTEDQIIQLCRSLAFVDVVGFEYRLANDNDEIDLGFHLPVAIDDPVKWLSETDFSVLPEAIASHPSWQKLKTFFTIFDQRSDFAKDAISFWLEFDTGAAYPDGYFPNFFVSFSGPKAEKTRENNVSRDAKWFISRFRDIAKHANGDGISEEIDKEIQHILELGSHHSDIIHFGTMLGRPVQAYKMSIGIPVPEIPKLLEKVLDTQMFERVMREVPQFMPRDSHVLLQFEFYKGLVNRIDFEISAPAKSRAGPGYRNWLLNIGRSLQKIGLAQADRLQDLLEWDAVVHHLTGDGRRGDQPKKQEFSVSHLKYTIKRDKVSFAKAYVQYKLINA